jgi:hypothetical protein
MRTRKTFRGAGQGLAKQERRPDGFGRHLRLDPFSRQPDALGHTPYPFKTTGRSQRRRCSLVGSERKSHVREFCRTGGVSAPGAGVVCPALIPVPALADSMFEGIRIQCARLSARDLVVPSDMWPSVVDQPVQSTTSRFHGRWHQDAELRRRCALAKSRERCPNLRSLPVMPTIDFLFSCLLSAARRCR